MAEVTSPIITDTTGQNIVSAISGLGQTLGSDRALIDGSNIANPSAFRQAIGLNKFAYNETIILNPATSGSSTLTYGDACYLLIGLIATSVSNRGFLMVLFNVHAGAVHYTTISNTTDFTSLTLNANNSINVNFGSARYANLEIYQLTEGY